MKKVLPLVLALALMVAAVSLALSRRGGQPPEYTFTRDWLRKGNLWVFDQPSPAYLRELGATGTAFSVYFIGFNRDDRAYVDSLHRSGFRVCSNFPCGQSTITENLQLREAACQRDVHGNPILLLGLEGLYDMCGNHPLWRDFLMGRIAEHARGGVDAILLDEPGDIGDCFCDYCMQAFNRYLAEHYSQEELRRLFGIEDLSTFSYRDYLLERGGSHWWDDPNPQLQSAYLQARYSDRVEFIGELIRHAKEAAGWDIPVTANVYGLEPNHQIFVPLLDFAIFEMPVTPEAHPDVSYLRPLPGRNLTVYLLAEALDPEKPFTAFPDVRDLLQLSRDIQENAWWLWRHWLAEARACGASFMIPHEAYIYGGGSYTIPAEKISPYTRFFADHPEFYENLERVASVGLLHDLHSTLTNRFTWLTHSAWGSFRSIGALLEEAHIPFEVVYRGDGVFVQKPLSLEELRKYRAVVVPRDYDLDQEALNTLEQYSAAGGTVIWCDRLSDYSQLVPALRGLGVDPGLETGAPQDLGLVVYRSDNSLVVHLLNYRYDRGRWDFSDLENFTLTLAVPEGLSLEGRSLKVVSPDSGEVVLDYELREGRVTFTVPSLHCYSVAFFE